MRRKSLFLIIVFLIVPIITLPFEVNFGKQLPAYSLSKLNQLSGNELANRLDAWFVERLSYFPILVRAKNELLYRIGFSDELVFGQDGYAADRATLEDIIPQVDGLTDRELQFVVKRLSSLRDYLGNKGVYFVVCIIPYKTTKDAPPFDKKFHRKSFGLERLQNELLREKVPFVDVLTEYRVIQETHYKTDVHNNSFGKVLVLGNLLAHLHNKFSLEFTEKRLKKDEYWFEGANNNGMPKLLPFGEYTTAYSVVDPAPFEQERVGDVLTFKPIGSSKVRLPKTLMIGNSFMLGYENLGIVDYFEKFSRIFDFTEFKNFESHLSDNEIVILHLYEGQISFHLNTTDYWPAMVSRVASD